MNKVITISREFGSGGRTIGRKVALKLGIKCYDQELIEEIAKQSGFAEEYIKERGEYMASSGIGAFFGGRDYNGHSIQDEFEVKTPMQGESADLMTASCPSDIMGGNQIYYGGNSHEQVCFAG
jgi:hypothetical protein